MEAAESIRPFWLAFGDKRTIFRRIEMNLPTKIEDSGRLEVHFDRLAFQYAVLRRELEDLRAEDRNAGHRILEMMEALIAALT
jgi:hypothetical protein